MQVECVTTGAPHQRAVVARKLAVARVARAVKGEPANGALFLVGRFPVPGGDALPLFELDIEWHQTHSETTLTATQRLMEPFCIFFIEKQNRILIVLEHKFSKGYKINDKIV